MRSSRILKNVGRVGEDVSAGDLEDAVARFCFAESGGKLGEEDALAGPAAGEKGFLEIVSGFCPDEDGDAGVTAADAEFWVLHHHREGLAGSVPLF